MNHLKFGTNLLDSLDLVKERTGIEALFYRKLVGRALENNIVNLVLNGKNTIKEIAGLINFPEYTIRNKVNKLDKITFKIEGKKD